VGERRREGETERKTDGWMDGHADRQTVRQTYIHADRQSDRHIYIHTYRETGRENDKNIRQRQADGQIMLDFYRIQLNNAF
jgi:hypothetical protein